MAILVLSATSDIAKAGCALFQARGQRLLLAVRNVSAVTESANAKVIPYDAWSDEKDAASAEAFWHRCVIAAQDHWNETIDGVYVAQGYLPPGDVSRWKDELEKSIFLNFTSVALFLDAVARWMEQAGDGKKRWIAVISSVAADRGRRSNYPYGAAKAGLDAYLSGLRARMFGCGVHVLTVRPGLVRTKMIAGRPQADSVTAVCPEKIAGQIDRAIRRRRNILYTPGWWFWMMFFVRSIPECLFKRMKV
ncbi:MAG: SDR family NAD(P)-dependent oxidoreductase [Planctomycetia bacterium]|nr:SDR family NAD(P)-dependent oxidoreductase [Planctomycetia bacterium]